MKFLRCQPAFCLLILLTSLAPQAMGRWWDGKWAYRRPIEVIWDDQRGGNDELAMVEFYTAGHHRPDGSDIRVATDDGKCIPSHVLMVGPGDRVRLVFALQPRQRHYQVYFGNPNPLPPPAGTGNATYQRGVLLEMRRFGGKIPNDFAQMEKEWNLNRQVIGQTMIERPFLGLNPFGDVGSNISRYSGSLFAPQDGDYTFAISADNRGALYIDKQPLVFSTHPAHDIRFTGRTNLKRGWHDFLLYSINRDSDIRVSVGWRTPGNNAVRVIDRMSFGIVYHGQPGRMEGRDRTFVADFKMEYLGETFFADHYAHRYRLMAIPPSASVNVTYEWEFGDGQISSGPLVDHVFLSSGVYPVRLTMKFGNNTDSQATRLDVHRQFERLDNPPTDDLALHSRIVSRYNINLMPMDDLLHSAQLHQRAGQMEAMIAVGKQIAASPTHPNPATTMTILREITVTALEKQKAEAAVQLWSHVPAKSDLHPHASQFYAELLIWSAADFHSAVKVLAPYAEKKNPALLSLYGQALVLDQKAEEGRKILESLPTSDSFQRQTAISGALARSIEFYIDKEDWQSGEAIWDRWQKSYPADFLEGYSVMLRTKLMAIRGASTQAAKVAEAFATAVPKSSYAPQLLNRASRLLEKSDPAKSKELRQLLKQRYPEDPLSQGK